MLRSAARIFLHALTCLGALLLLITVAPLKPYIDLLSGPWPDSRGPVLIVLAGDSFGEKMLGESSFLRCVYAVQAWREGGFRRVILSGHGEITDSMRDYILCHGIPAAALTVEDRSNSTHENAVFTARVASQFPGPYVLLTSDYHMWRAHRAFTKAGLTVEPRPLPDALKRGTDWRSRWRVFLDLGLETCKIVYYWFRGWV